MHTILDNKGKKSFNLRFPEEQYIDNFMNDSLGPLIQQIRKGDLYEKHSDMKAMKKTTEAENQKNS